MPRVPSSFARPELSCSWRPERRGRVALGGPGGGRPCPARGRTRHKALYAVPPGPPDDRPFPPQADPPELDSVSRRAAASDPSAGMLSVFIEGRPRPRGRREDRGSRPVFVEPLQSFRIALSCALLRLLRYFKRLTQKGKGMLHKTQRGDRDPKTKARQEQKAGGREAKMTHSSIGWVRRARWGLASKSCRKGKSVSTRRRSHREERSLER